MKKILTLAAAVMFFMTAMAQYKTINYQGVLTKADGTPISNTGVWMLFQFGTESNPYMGAEEAQVFTNEEGFFSHEIGSVSGFDFSTIDWAQSGIQIKVDAYNFDGSGDIVTIVTPISAVPAAMYAMKSGDTEQLKQDVESINAQIVGLDGAVEDFRIGLLDNIDDVNRLYDDMYAVNTEIESIKTWIDIHGENLDDTVREMVEKLLGEGIDTTPMIEQLRADMEAMQALLEADMKSGDDTLFNEMMARDESIKNYTNERVDELWKSYNDLTNYVNEQDNILRERVDIIVNTVDMLKSWLDTNEGKLLETVKEMVEKIIATGIDTAPIMEQLRAEMNTMQAQLGADIDLLRHELLERMDLREKQLFAEMVDGDNKIDYRLSSIADNFTVAIENLQKYIEHVHVEQDELMHDVEVYKADFDQRTEQLASQLTELPEVIQDLQDYTHNQISNLKNDVDKNSYYLNQLENQLETQLAANDASIANNMAALSMLESENQALKNELANQQYQIDDLKAYINALSDRSDSQKAMIDMLMQEIQQLKADKQ